MTPLISVALSTYQGARHLPMQLDSLLAQRGVELEIVAVDDGSDDATIEILAAYAVRDQRLRWSANPGNLGPTRSFERALSLCTGAWLAPCDQDDVWHPDKLATLHAAIGDHDLAYCDSEYVDAEGRSMGRRVSTQVDMLQGQRPLTFLFANSVSGHASLLRRDLFDAARPFPEGVYHDWWLALCAAGRKGIVYVPEALVQFRRHTEAFSPMGKGRSGDSRGAQTSRTWLEHRYRLMDAYSKLPFSQHEAAARLAAALRQAIDGGRAYALLPVLWRFRRELPAWQGRPELDALKLYSRLLRKLRRARRAPA
jgi:glycosyltransferase involved in cell wall biosynthesis